MRKSSVVFELTDGEIRAFWFSVLPFRKLGHSSTKVKFDRISIPTGIMEQGTVRDENSLIQILSNYRLHHAGNSRKVYLAVSLHQGFVGSYSLPWISKWDRNSAISLLVDEEISIARSDLLYDYLVISEEKHKSLQVLLGATRRSILEQYALIFEEAGFKVIGIDFAYSILGQALGFEIDKDVLYLQEELGNLQMALFRGAVPESVRSLPTLLAKDESEERLKRWSEEWKNEIGRFLLYHKTRQPDLDLKRLVWRGGSVVNQLAQEFSASNQTIMIEQAVLKDIPDSWQKLLKENKGLSEAAIGYGLRILSHRPGLNLWCQPAIKQKHKRTCLGLGFLASVFLVAGTLIWLAICHSSSVLQQEVTQLARQGTRIEEQNRYQDEHELAWKKVSTNSEKIGERLVEVQALAGTRLKIEQVVFKQGILSVRGSANDSKSVQAVIKDLRVLGWEEPTLSSYKLTALNSLEFTLSAKYGRINSETSKKIVPPASPMEKISE